MESLVDPAVSRAKFTEELKTYQIQERAYCARGWFLVKAEFPEVFVIFATPKVKPAILLFGVILDFTNYDFWPPSVRLVDPYSRVPYKFEELPSKLNQRIALERTPKETRVKAQPLMQQNTVSGVPFLCLRGVREYHDNPAHTGDSWLQLRGTGFGSLYYILDQISKYGVDPVVGFDIQIQLGLKNGIPPE